MLLVILWIKPPSTRISLVITHASPETVTFKEHPILTLAKAAALEHEQKLSHQSTTIEQATEEYTRRYSRAPPPGFQHWFEYAKAEDSPIIDDFDVLDDALVPLLRRSGAEISQNIREATSTVSWLRSCKIGGSRLGEGCEILGDVIMRLFSDVRILQHLPDVEMLINAFDEPRVLLAPYSSTRVSSRHRRQEVEALTWTDLSQRNAWKELVVDQCPEIDEASNSRNGLNFVRNTTDALDLCQHREYEHMHGFWESPTTLKVTRAALPVLSPAVISTMNDIPLPARAYTHNDYSYDSAEAVDYEKKIPGLYWAGKTTGGWQTVDTEDWVPLHRQRFVSLANDIDQEAHTYLRRKAGSKRWETVSDNLDKTMYNVHFTGVVQCEDEACDHQEEYFDVHEGDPRSKALEYTLTFDLDGNGHSARFYRFLESRSLPLKQTVFREWHEDRLQPWLHYIPISLEMDEVPEVVRYLVQEEEGRALAKELAMKGREWTQRALRPVDQVIYLYRLLLELARLQDPMRIAMQ